jgi:hypothetical protein
VQVRVLGEFSKLREAEYARSDYMQLLTSDLCSCYGYNADLIELVCHAGDRTLDPRP